MPFLLIILKFYYIAKKFMVEDLKNEIAKEEKTFNILLIAVLSPILVGFVVISVYLINLRS